MSTVVLRVMPSTLWLALFMSTLALLFAIEGVLLRFHDWWTPPVEMTWRAEVLPDGRYAVRFSGVKYRSECELIEIRAWAGDDRLSVNRDGPARNRRLPAGPFGPSLPWTLIPTPVGEPRIVAEFDCSRRDVQVEVLRAAG